MTGSPQDWRGILPDSEIAEIERVSAGPPAQAIRLNTLKIDPAEARQSWPGEYGWQVEPVPFCPAGWRFTARPEGLSRTLEYRMGFYYIQDVASMLPAEMFSPLGDSPLVLDLAAAPGGKTTHLACQTADRGLIVANDISGGRAGALLSNLRRWGTTSAVVTNLPGERLGRWLPEAFDAVLVDAPCSGENLRSPAKRGAEGGSKGRQVSARERRALHDRQVRLLLSAFGAVRPGGEVVYATCTVAPEEDESVLDDILGKVGRAAEVVRPPHLAGLPGGLAAYREQSFDPQVAGAARVWPHLFDTGAFFAALIRKRDSFPSETEPLPRSGRGDFKPLPSRDRAQIAAALRDAYGFDLAALLDDRGLDLWHAGRLVHAIPRLLDVHFGGLPVRAAGMLLGELGEDGFAASHELVSRFAGQFSGGRLRLPDEQIDSWLAGGELRGVDAPVGLPGRVVLLEDSHGRFLGRGRVSGGRIRGLLPAGF